MRRTHRLRAIGGYLCAWLAIAGGSATLRAEDASARPKYIRVERDADGKPLALQTSVVEFRSRDPQQASLQVDLIGAVHVGEKGYYDALNKLFESYDVVLYELVAPEGTRIAKGAKSSGHPVALLQNGLKDVLGLEHQIQHVDYTKANLLHADMSPDDFAKSMSDRDESWGAMFFRMMGQGIAQQSKLQAQGKSTEADLLLALFDRNRSSALKRVMADQFESLEGMMGALEGPKGSTIITERNKVALKKLGEQIKAGKHKIGIFYGAGHLGDMEKRLGDDFQLDRRGERWLTAWDLVGAKAPGGRRDQPRREALAKGAIATVYQATAPPPGPFRR